MKTLSITIAIIAVLVGVSCSDSETGPITTAQKNVQDVQRLSFVPSTPTVESTLMTYYDENLYRVFMTRLSKQATAMILDSEILLSKVFTVEDLSQPQPFHLVLDFDGNGAPVIYCMVYLIKFENGAVPHQFYSMSEIDAAIASGEISIDNTERVYSCLFL